MTRGKKFLALAIILALLSSLIFVVYADDDAYEQSQSVQETSQDELDNDEFLSFACLVEMGIDIFAEDDFSNDTVFKFVPSDLSRLSRESNSQNFTVLYKLEVIDEDIFNEYMNNVGVVNFSLDALDDVVVADLIELGALQANLVNEEFGEPEVLALGVLYAIGLDSEPRAAGMAVSTSRQFTAVAPNWPTASSEIWVEQISNGRLFSGMISITGSHRSSTAIGGVPTNIVTASYAGWLTDRGIIR